MVTNYKAEVDVANTSIIQRGDLAHEKPTAKTTRTKHNSKYMQASTAQAICKEKDKTLLERKMKKSWKEGNGYVRARRQTRNDSYELQQVPRDQVSHTAQQ